MSEEAFIKVKQYLEKLSDKNQGFSLVEVMASLAIISLLMVGLYGLMMMSLRVTADNGTIVQATEIANQRMEQIRNLPYDSVGTASGSPSGVIPEFETVVRNGVYTVHTMIMFYDDPYDGTAGAGDTIPVDYKIASIEVSWLGKFGPKKITVFSKIVPNTEETLTGYGLLKLITVDASGAIVPNADIHIVNTLKGVDATYVSDLAGQFYNAFLPDFEGYEVTVSKAGYATEKTYARTAPNLNPTKPNLSIFDGAKTEESFSIDRLANFTIRTVSDNLPDNWRVNASTSNDNLNSNLALDQNDNLYFVWQNNGPATSTIFLQKYDSTNVKVWADDIAISTSSFQVNPDLATTKTGVSYVVWQDDSTSLKQLAYSTHGNIVKVARSPAPVFNIKKEIKRIVQSGISSVLNGVKSWWQSLLAFGVKESRTPKAIALSNVTIVQTKISSAVSFNNSITATFDSPPAAGNVLIAVAVHRNGGRSFSAPTNGAGTFTVSRYSNSAWDLDTGIWHKVTGASEPSAVTITSNGSISGGVLMLLEVAGLDTASLLNVTAANDQTGSSGWVANTGTTSTSTNDSFAVAAVAFADNDFDTPVSANWASISADSWTHRLWTDWSTGNDGSLAVATMNISASNTQRATLTLTGTGSAEERNSALAVFKALPLNQATVSAAGSQNTSVVIPQTDYYLGGKFIVAENNSSRNVNSVILSEFGTVNAQTSISAVKLYYDLDTGAPYDCASESFNSGTDAEFGAAAVFDAADGSAQITQAGGINITTTKSLCLYPVVSITSATINQTLDLKINNPATDVLLSTGSSSPASIVDINGSTQLKTPSDIRQAHARLRSDDGNESDATWKNTQDSPGTIYLNDKLRLRFELTNRGGTSSPAFAYRLEYGVLNTDCDSISSWSAVPNDNSLDWKTVDSSYFIDATPSSNIANGLTDENLSFTASELKDTGNQATPLALDYINFTELEFSVAPTATAGDKSYCFRLTDQGDDSSISYENYAVVSIKGDENIFLRAVDAAGNFSWPTKRVNSEIGDSHQTKPVIALTENFGTATSAVAWEDNRNGATDVYLQILDQNGTRLLASDLQISTSTDADYSPALAFDSLDNLYVVWIESGSSQDIYLSKFDLNGNLLLGPIALKNSADQETTPKIIFDAADNLYLSYTLEIGGIKNARIAMYDSALTQFWDSKPNTASSSVSRFNGQLARSGSTMFSIWNDERNGDKDLYAQKIDASGTPLWTNDLKVNIGLDSADQVGPGLAVRSTLTAVGAWTDNRNNKQEIFATEFTDPGALSGVANVPLVIVGTKRIGENPIIYKYNEIHTTDGSGNSTIALDWDVPGYSVSIYAASSSKTIILRDPPQPLNFMPADNKTMLIYVD